MAQKPPKRPTKQSTQAQTKPAKEKPQGKSDKNSFCLRRIMFLLKKLESTVHKNVFLSYIKEIDDLSTYNGFAKR